jgi:hypothetical protein
MSPGQRTPDGGYIPVRRESIIITAEQAQAAAARSAVVVVVAILATSVIVCVCVCGFRQGGQSKSQSDTRARRGPAGDARAVVAFLLVPPMARSVGMRPPGRRRRRPGPGRIMEADRSMHRENRLPQGREHGAVTPRARDLEPKLLLLLLRAPCDCARMHARPGPLALRTTPDGTRRAAKPGLAWPGPSNHGRVQ